MCKSATCNTFFTWKSKIVIDEPPPQRIFFNTLYYDLRPLKVHYPSSLGISFQSVLVI